MATGNHLVQFHPFGAELPTTLYATLGIRNLHPTLDFDPTVTWTCHFSGVLPSHYTANGLTIDIIWMGASATTGNVLWGVAMERLNTSQDTDSFAAQVTGVGTVNGVLGITTTTSVLLSSGAAMDGLLINEEFRLQVQRIGGDAADTMLGNASITKVVIRET